MYPLTITTAQNERELYLLKRFLLQQPQFYPKFEQWVLDKCIPRIQKGVYKAIIVLSSRGVVIGDVIYRRDNKDTINLRNLRIDPEYRRRDLGHFLLSQVNYEAIHQNITLDVTADNFAGVEFFIRNGFHIIKKERLYKPDQDEFIMIRPRNKCLGSLPTQG